MKFDYIKQNLIIVFSSIFAGICNWLFGYLVIKLFHADDIAIFYGFAGLVGLLSLPSIWITYITTSHGKEVAVLLKQKFLGVNLLVFSITLTIFLFIFTELTNNFVYFSLIALVLVSSFISAYYRGLLQNQLKFFLLGNIIIVENIFKISILIIFFYFNVYPLAAIFAYVIQTISTTIVLKYYTNNIQTKINKDVIKKTAMYTLYFSVGVVCFTNMDVVFARSFLNVGENTQYIVLIQIVKLLIFPSIAIVSGLYSNLSKKPDIKSILKMSLVSFLFITFGFVVLISTILFKFQLISMLFNIEISNKYFTELMLIFGYLYSLSLILMNLLLVRRGKYLGIIVISNVVIQSLLYIYFARYLYQFVMIYGISSVLTFCSCLLVLIAVAYKKKKLQL